MNDVYRLAWEPAAEPSVELVSSQVMKYMDNAANFAQFPSGACLMLSRVENMHENILSAMQKARRLADFKVYPMQDGDFLVFFASALMVYVGKDEFQIVHGEVSSRKEELQFPSESFISNESSPDRDLLVGLYARGKLQHDAWNTRPYKIVKSP